MPFINEQRQPHSLTNVAPADQPPLDPSLLQTFGAAFRTENVVGSFLSSRGQADPYQIEDGFDAIDYVKDDPKYAPYVTDFSGIFNKKAADAKKLQIDGELRDRRTIDAAGGMGTVAAMAAGVFDLPTLLPVGGGVFAAGRGIARTAAGAAIGAGIDATVSETGLQVTQATRTGEETTFNIGGSILLGGALGTLVGRYLSQEASSAMARKIEGQEKGFEEFDTAFATGGSSAGAAARDTGPTVLKDENIIKHIPGVNKQDPLIRLQLSEIDSARQTVRGLAETPLEYADNARGIATELGGSVETRMKMWNAPLASSLENIDTSYARYFNNAPEPTAWQTRLSPIKSEFQRLTGGQKLTYKQFKEEVGKAAFNNQVHAIPEVAEAAKTYRAFDESMKKAAIEAGLLPEDIAVKGDVSHLFRMYNKDRIIARRGEFSRILNDYFVTKRDEAARIAEKETAVAAPIAQTPPDGFVRFFHGGEDADTGGARWVSPDPDYARNFRSVDGQPKKVWFVDIAKDDLALEKSKLWDEIDEKAGTNMVGRYSNFEIPEHLAMKLKPLDDLAAKTEGKAAPSAKMTPEAQKAAEFGRMSDNEVKELVEETIDTILGNAEGRVPYDSIVSGPRGPLKERLLGIESKKIQDFMELDIEHVLHAQVRTMSADVELAKKFGSVDMKEEIRKVNDEANRKIANVDKSDLADADKEKARKKLQKSRERAIKDIEGIRDRLRGQFALPSNPDGLLIRTGRVVRNLNYLRLLGGMTISALPDMAGVVLKHGMTSTFRDGFIPLITNFRGFRAAAEEVKQAGTALDMILDSRAMALADITGDYGRNSKIERGIQSLSSRFGVASLMAPWNASMKQFSGMIVMTNVLKSAERLAKGTADASEIRKLAAGGIDADMAQRIYKQFAEHGNDNNGILLAQAGKWSDRQAIEAFRAAVVRDVDRIIVTPGQDKPLWMSHELGKVVGQFRSFGISAMQRTMLAGLQQRDAATLNGVMLAMGLGATSYWAKQTLAGRELSDNPAVWVVESIDKSGLTGWFMDANNIAEKATRGHVGLSAVTGEEVSRFASRNVTGAFLGPSADALADIFQVSGSVFAGDTTKADLRKMRQLVPMQNLFYIRSLLNQVEEATGQALSLPDTRK